MIDYKLTLEEQETIIRYDEKWKTADIYTHHKALKKKLDKLCEDFPEEFTRKNEDEYIIPKRYITVRAPRVLSEKQKEALQRARVKAHGLNGTG